MLATHNAKDCVVFITNNGMQSEMRSIAKVVSDYHIPVVTITSTSDNPVAKRSDIILSYGQTDENENAHGCYHFFICTNVYNRCTLLSLHRIELPVIIRFHYSI